MREKLRELYEAFIKKWGGRLNSQKVKRVLKAHPSYFVVAASLEIKTESGWRDADILHKGKDEIEQIVTEDPIEALGWVLGVYGYVDIAKIAAIVDKDELEVLHELGDLVYLNPDTMSYESADKFLSGNVYMKLQKAKKALKELEMLE